MLFPLAFGYGLQWTGGSYGPGFAAVAAVGLVAGVVALRARLPESSTGEIHGFSLRDASGAPPRVKMQFARAVSRVKRPLSAGTKKGDVAA
jgi:hypothetical protein